MKNSNTTSPTKSTLLITSGICGNDVRNTLPYKLADYYRSEQPPLAGEDRHRSGGIDTPPGGGPFSSSNSDRTKPNKLVYNSITQTEQKDTITHFDIFAESVRINRASIHSNYKPTPPDRSETTLQGFSIKSKSRLHRIAINAKQKITSQYCMTYADTWPTDGKELKRQLNVFLTMLRRKFPLLHYIWVGEFQTRGAPHFHLFSDIPVTPENLLYLGNLWHKVSGVSVEKHRRFHVHPKNFISWDMGNAGYLTKYLDKEHQKVIPAGFSNFGRFWGNSQNLKMRIEQTITPDELKLFTVGHDKPAEFLLRQLCRYDETKNPRSTIRKTPQSRYVLTGAPIIRQLLEYLHKPPAGWYPEKDQMSIDIPTISTTYNPQPF